VNDDDDDDEQSCGNKIFVALFFGYIEAKANGYVVNDRTSDPTILFISRTLTSALSC
jgi:hypothetical protein